MYFFISALDNEMDDCIEANLAPNAYISTEVNRSAKSRMKFEIVFFVCPFRHAWQWHATRCILVFWTRDFLIYRVFQETGYRFVSEYERFQLALLLSDKRISEIPKSVIWLILSQPVHHLLRMLLGVVGDLLRQQMFFYALIGLKNSVSFSHKEAASVILLKSCLLCEESRVVICVVDRATWQRELLFLAASYLIHRISRDRRCILSQHEKMWGTAYLWTSNIGAFCDLFDGALDCALIPSNLRSFSRDGKSGQMTLANAHPRREAV